jgi:hypothetical protein
VALLNHILKIAKLSMSPHIYLSSPDNMAYKYIRFTH